MALLLFWKEFWGQWDYISNDCRNQSSWLSETKNGSHKLKKTRLTERIRLYNWKKNWNPGFEKVRNWDNYSGFLDLSREKILKWFTLKTFSNSLVLFRHPFLGDSIKMVTNKISPEVKALRVERPLDLCLLEYLNLLKTYLVILWEFYTMYFQHSHLPLLLLTLPGSILTSLTTTFCSRVIFFFLLIITSSSTSYSLCYLYTPGCWTSSRICSIYHGPHCWRKLTLLPQYFP